MGCSESALVFYLWTMTSGQPHPAAEHPIINCPREADAWVAVSSVSITNSRLAILVGHPCVEETGFVVLDWRTGRILLVCDPLSGQSPYKTKILG